MKKLITTLTFFLLLVIFCAAQDVTTRGKVVTAGTGTPIPGATVQVKGTPLGTSTNIDGEFTIKTKPNAPISVSFIGMRPYEFVASGKYVTVELKEDTQTMDEVVVVGYGVQKKALVTGSNLNVKGSDIAKLNTGSAMEALQGVAPGVTVTRNSGAPGSGTKVTIRGLGTIGDSNPLYIVDGVSVGNIDYLSANDIETIDVLKDAASSAIYGSRAANGVVLVTTKKAKGGTRSITYDSYYGVQNIYKTVPTLNAQEYMFIMDEANVNDGKAPNDWEAKLKNMTWLNDKYPGNLGTQLGDEIWKKLQSGWTGTNWVNEMSKKNAAVQNHSINVVGSNQDVNYSLGFSYFNQDGIIGGDVVGAGYKRITGRINTEYTLFKNSDFTILKIGENLTYTNSENKAIATGDIYWNDLHNAIVQAPLSPVYWDKSPDANKFTPTLEGIHKEQYNPIARMFYNNNYRWGKGNTIVGNVYAELQPIKNLKFRSSFGINAWFGYSRSWTPIYALGTSFKSAEDAVQQDMNQGVAYTLTNTLTYERVFGKHKVTALVGQEMLKNVLSMTVGGRKMKSNFGLPNYAYLNNVNKTTLEGIDTWGNDWSAQGGGLLSYMTRLSYNFSEKYMVDLVMRADASSNFASNRRWGYFPSFSAGWNFSEEPFVKELNIISYGKLRANWGQNGNQSIPNFIYTSNIAYLDHGYYFGDGKPTSSITSVPNNIANKSVGWETSEQTDVGLDLRLLNSRLSLTFDWYKKVTKGWLVQAPQLGTAGANAPYINGGDIKNSGIEFSLRWNDTVGDLTYSATFSGTKNKNRVTRLANAEGIITGPENVLSQGTAYVSRVEVGEPIGYFYGYKTAGILQNQADVDSYVDPKTHKPYFDDQRPGDIRFVDLNGDGVIDDNDKTKIGDPNPDFELGFQLNIDYKGWYMSTSLAGKFGMQVMQSYRSFSDRLDQNYTTAIFGRWHGEGTSNTLPRLSSVTSRNNNMISDIYIHDADFIRVNNLTLGYNFTNLIKSVKWLKAAKVYVAANNLYTFTKYDGMDPDVRWYGSTYPDGTEPNWASGVDLGLYPLPRTFMMGLNLTF